MPRVSSLMTAAVLVALATPSVFAREPASSRRAAVTAAPAQDLLAAEAEGLVAIRFIPNDARSAQVIVTNKSKRPLTLRLPDAFAGVPVLAQMAGGGGAGFGAGGIGGVPQNVGGGGMQNQGMGIGQPGGGGGPFSLPPEKTRTLKVATVCLEHGKREPAPRIPYRMTALDSCTSDPRLADVMAGLSSGQISQKVAQAAAWHIASGLSWERLAAEAIHMAGGDPDVPFFTPAELVAARRVVEVTTQRQAASEPASRQSAAR
jgi:hypothetical protein